MICRNPHISVIFVALSLAAVADGDQIVTSGESYIGATIVGLQEGRLRFQTATGSPRVEPLTDVNLIVVDQGGVFTDFNQAERMRADGDAQRSVVRYRRTKRLVEGFWNDLIDIRIFQAQDTAGQLDHATTTYLDILEGTFSGPAAAASLFPKSIPDRPNAKVGRAIDRLDRALSRPASPERTALLEVLRYDILRRTGNARAASSAHRIVALKIPPQCRSSTVYEVVLHALERELAGGANHDGLDGLNRTIRNGPRSLLPQLLLLKGNALLKSAASREELIRAAWPFLRIPIHFPDDPRVPDGLLGAATVLERIGRKNRALNLLRECLSNTQITDAMRSRATEALTRLRSKNPG